MCHLCIACIIFNFDYLHWFVLRWNWWCTMYIYNIQALERVAVANTHLGTIIITGYGKFTYLLNIKEHLNAWNSGQWTLYWINEPTVSSTHIPSQNKSTDENYWSHIPWAMLPIQISHRMHTFYGDINQLDWIQNVCILLYSHQFSIHLKHLKPFWKTTCRFQLEYCSHTCQLHTNTHYTSHYTKAIGEWVNVGLSFRHSSVLEIRVDLCVCVCDETMVIIVRNRETGTIKWNQSNFGISNYVSSINSDC